MILIMQPDGPLSPYIHAAIEEYMVRHMDASHGDILLMYVNRPCVVVGKNQSIYKELNHQYLCSTECCVVRRVSGGGTVYHDEGNLCFAIISKHEDSKVNNYRYFNQPIVDALRQADIPAEFSPRNDILWNGKKISGNAQFTNRKNIISHGTLLVKTDLDKLRFALSANPFVVESKAISSVRSTVMNISEGTERFTTAAELRHYLSTTLPIQGRYSFSSAQWMEIESLAEQKFSSLQWTLGRNPHTVVSLPDLRIEIENGKVIHSSHEAYAHLIGSYYWQDKIVLPNIIH